MKKVLLSIGLIISSPTFAAEVEDLFKESMNYYRNAIFCLFYDKANKDNDLYMSSYFSIAQSVEELEESLSWPGWKAKEVLDHIVIQEVVEQSSTNDIAKLKNRCENISNHAIHSSAKRLRSDIAKLKKAGKM